MIKLLLDGLTMVVWTDDSQVTEVSGRKQFVEELGDARTEVVVYRLGFLDQRTGICEHCSNEFPAYRSQKDRRFCSKACDSARRAAARIRRCPRCDSDFDPKHTRQKYCSPTCHRGGHVVESACVECARVVRQPASWAQMKVPACSPECRRAYWRKNPALTARGNCATCGGPTSRKTYTRCRPCATGELVLTIREATT
jgi:hypothetical protein